MVIATENPIEFHGTYPLPEAQMDRFLVRLPIGYPTAEVEVDILKSHAHNEPLDRIKPVLQLEQVRQIQQEVTNVHVDDGILEYIVEIVHATRHDNRLQLGISTRGTLMLSRAARARAYFQKRDFVIPDDVLWLVPYVFPHRILVTAKTRHSGTTARQIVMDIVGRIKVPV
jgi:MoxR-like ATPase